MTRIALAAAMFAVAAPAHAESWDFVLVNKTGKSVKLVEVASAGSGTWSKEKRDEDRGPKSIKPGEDYTVHFEREAKACKFDVRMTFEDDSQTVWPGFDVCKFAFGDFALNGETATVKGS